MGKNDMSIINASPVLRRTGNLAWTARGCYSKVKATIAKRTRDRRKIGDDSDLPERVREKIAQVSVNLIGAKPWCNGKRIRQAQIKYAWALWHESASGATQPDRPSTLGKLGANRIETLISAIAKRGDEPLRPLPQHRPGSP